MNRAAIMERLIPIWQRVLQRPSVRAGDNFFDLGGNPSSAAKLSAEISEVFHRRLPPVLIYSAPTIETFAALLEQPKPPRVPPLLLLKNGTEQPPVYITHGIGGTVFDFFQLVHKIDSSHPIYGMQAKGVDGVDEALTSIEEMAQFHLHAIKELQPQGPYFLLGYSLGGLVMLEIAQRLSEAGERIGLLVLVDTYPHKSKLTSAQRRQVTLRLARRRASSLMRLVMGRPRPKIAADPVMLRMRQAENLAWERYQPKYYSGEMKYVKAATRTEFPDDSFAIWSPLAAKFEIETAPGNHVGLLTTEFDKLGTLLTRYLEDAFKRI